MSADEQVLNGTVGLDPDQSAVPEVRERFTVASVNLLPTRYARAMALRRAKLFAAIALMIGVLAVVLAWTITAQQRGAAQEKLDIAMSERSLLQSQANKYADVPRVFAEVADAQIQFRDAMASEVRWSFFLNDLALTIPSGVSLDTLQVVVADPGTSQVVGSGAAGTIGTMNVTAKALRFNTVANWLDAIAKWDSLTNPQVASISAAEEEGTDLVTFGSSADITSEALSGRYAEEGTQP